MQYPKKLLRSDRYSIELPYNSLKFMMTRHRPDRLTENMYKLEQFSVLQMTPITFSLLKFRYLVNIFRISNSTIHIFFSIKVLNLSEHFFILCNCTFSYRFKSWSLFDILTSLSEINRILSSRLLPENSTWPGVVLMLHNSSPIHQRWPHLDDCLLQMVQLLMPSTGPNQKFDGREVKL